MEDNPRYVRQRRLKEEDLKNNRMRLNGSKREE